MAQKIFIKTFGCQMNEYDSNRIYDSVKKIGYQKTENYEESCYLSKDNIQIEYQYGLDTQTNNLNLMGLSKSTAVDLEKYCKYTK